MKILDILTAPWAIIPAKFKEITEVYQTHMKGEKIDLDIFKPGAKFGQDQDDVIEEKLYEVVNGVAVIHIQGILSKKLSFFSWLFGGSSTLFIAEAFKSALNDSAIKAILLNIDSPGGSVDGTAELAELIYKSRGQKPIIAFTDGVMASAAYWIGSAVDKIFISSDTTGIGSIGVIATHIDYSERYKREGIKISQIFAGKYKNIGSRYKPLSDEDGKIIQDRVDYIYSVFVNTIATYRGVSVDHVLKVMATDTPPPVFIGKQAITAGLVDGISTMDGLLNRLADGDSAMTFSFKGTMKEKTETKEVDNMLTLAELKEKQPELYKAVEAEVLGSEPCKSKYSAGLEEGKKIGMAEGLEKGKEEGAGAEKKRIQDVEAQLMPGHEKLIQELKFDGKTTGPEAAVKVLNDEKALKQAKGKAFDADGNEISVLHDPPPADGVGSDAHLPLKDRAQKTWDSSPDIRAEFQDDFEIYLAYITAEKAGRIKVLRK